MAGEMGFIGRAKETGILETQYSKPHPLVVITGRRRVGKSTLIREFIKGKNAVYYMADRTRPEAQLSGFSAAVCRALGTVPAQYASWSDAIDAYVQGVPGRKIIAIDELQYITSQDPDFLKMLQGRWEELSQKDVMMIVCGSHLTTMRKIIEDYRNPLHGRYTSDLFVRPIDFRDTIRGKGYRQSVEEYAVTGGVPYYMELMDSSVPAVENAYRLTMALGAPLREEPAVLMSDEFRETSSYNAYLASIARGNRKMDRICSNLQCKSSAVTPYLKTLSDIQLVERRVPVTDEDPENSRNGQYRISDAFTALWFQFVFPYRADIEARDTDEAEARLRAHFIDSHVSFVFEDISRRELRRHLRAEGIVARYGSYWDSGTEIDVVAVDSDHGRVFAGECKYRESPVGEDVLHALVRKASGVEAFEGMDITPCVFSVSGYTEGALREAERLGARLFDCGEPVPRSV